MSRVVELRLPGGEKLRVDRYRGLYRAAFYTWGQGGRHTAQHESLAECLTILLGELDAPYDPDVIARCVGPELPRPVAAWAWAELQPPISRGELEHELARGEGRLFA